MSIRCQSTECIATCFEFSIICDTKIKLSSGEKSFLYNTHRSVEKQDSF
jgi:hypothetical protein